MQKRIGEPVTRIEDLRLLTGRGQFSDDMNLPGQAYAAFVRSPHAHATLRAIDADDALRMEGVVAVLAGADYDADGLKAMFAGGNPKDVELKNRDGSPIFYTPLYPLVMDKARRVGEIVAIVVADTPQIALAAAESVAVDYEILPAVTDPASAEADATCIWDEAPGNLCVDDVKGDAAAVQAAFDGAAHVVDLEIVNNRVTGVPMEPRAAIGTCDPETGRLELFAGGQGVNRFQRELAHVFDVPMETIRVVSRDVGGGYGTRNHLYPEFVLALWAAKRLGRPVKWTCTRSEAFLSDYSGRDLVTRAALAVDDQGRFLAVRAENIGNLGSHSVSFVPIARGPTVTTSVYDIPLAYIETKGVFTNTAPVTAYRGAGRPESILVIERLIDRAAQATGIDRVEIRRRNLIPDAAIPYTNAIGVTYDSGAFGKSMDMTLAMADWDGFQTRLETSRGNGKLRGIGIANYIETATGWPVERAQMTVTAEGRVDLVIGTQASGQGHETSFAQIAVELLGVPFDSVDLRTGDTDFVTEGSGSHSSRTMRLGGHLFRQTADEIIEKGKRIAAHLLEAAAADVVFGDGAFSVAGTDRRISLFDVAVAADSRDVPEDLRGPLAAVADIDKPLPAYPNGCHIAEVEIDPETGTLKIVRYTGVDDVGRVINPLLADGQTQGGAVQGLGQAMMECCVHDPNSGQLLTGSFMDYSMPRADDVPFFDLGHNEVPTPTNLFGAKGAGEGGTTGAPPALINAIVHALRDYGVEHIEMPATSESIWRAMRGGG
jgi:carbon-monoxide dehydrogenase large subunit